MGPADSSEEKLLAHLQERLNAHRAATARREPHRADSVLQPLTKRLRLRKADPLEALHQAWEEVIPQPLQERTTVIAFRNGILHVETSHAAWKAETETFHKGALIASLRAALPETVHLRDVRIRLGGTS